MKLVSEKRLGLKYKRSAIHNHSIREYIINNISVLIDHDITCKSFEYVPLPTQKCLDINLTDVKSWKKVEKILKQIESKEK